MAGDGVIEFGNWIIEDALRENPCVKVPEFPDELTCLKLDESDVSAEWRVYVPKGSECPECKERQGYYFDAETIQRQQERIAERERERDEWQIKCCEEAMLHVSHVSQRDELIRDMYVSMRTVSETWAYDSYAERMRELGIEVDEEALKGDGE